MMAESFFPCGKLKTKQKKNVTEKVFFGETINKCL